MTAKLRIDIAAGILEAEGSEDFVRALYDDFRDRLGKITPATPPAPSDAGGSPAKRAPERRSGSTSVASGKPKTPSLVKDLDLATKGSRVGLKDFLKRYRALKNAQEFNTAFVYYLSKIAQVTAITVDHVYTCYKEVAAKPPTALVQSLKDTASRKGTLDTKSTENMKLTLRGENWIEHELEAADEAAA